MKPEIVPLTHEHVCEWYGDKGRRPTIKGIAAFIDGKLSAIGGVAFERGRVVAFCELKEEARPFKTAIHRTAVKVLADAKQRHRLIMAYCDPNEPTAEKWLSRLGFREKTDGVWHWRI